MAGAQFRWHTKINAQVMRFWVTSGTKEVLCSFYYNSGQWHWAGKVPLVPLPQRARSGVLALPAHPIWGRDCGQVTFLAQPDIRLPYVGGQWGGTRWHVLDCGSVPWAMALGAGSGIATVGRPRASLTCDSVPAVGQMMGTTARTLGTPGALLVAQRTSHPCHCQVGSLPGTRVLGELL